MVTTRGDPPLRSRRRVLRSSQRGRGVERDDEAGTLDPLTADGYLPPVSSLTRPYSSYTLTSASTMMAACTPTQRLTSSSNQ
jgi:hypothetical protein